MITQLNRVEGTNYKMQFNSIIKWLYRMINQDLVAVDVDMGPLPCLTPRFDMKPAEDD